jgi:hypothetical protein
MLPCVCSCKSEVKDSRLKALPVGPELRARLCELLEVDPASPSGLRWKVSPSHRAPAGSPAGTLTAGYWHVTVNYRRYRVHRLVWALTHDEDPCNHEIDHIDGRPGNNDPANLRLATSGENQHNYRKPRDNTSGHKGVSRHRQQAAWQAHIMLNGKHVSKWFSDSKHGGTESALAAAAGWVRAKREELHGEFARHE